MTVNAPNPFPSDALEANRRGELTEGQLQAFGHLARSRRKSALHAALLLVSFFASPTTSPALRALLTFTCLGIAAFLVARFVSGSDALAGDLRRRQVQCAQGAIGKSRMAAEGGADAYFLDVGNSRFSVARASYEAAPEAGHVRVYFLPRSRKVVNLERLPDAPVQPGVTVPSILRRLGTSILSPDTGERNEARASLAALSQAMRAAVSAPVNPPPQARDPRPLGQAILGTWSNAFITVSFSADGQVTTSVLGRDRPGRWSVDGDGRLHAEIAGRQWIAAACVAGDQLLVSAEGQGLTLTRRR